MSPSKVLHRRLRLSWALALIGCCSAALGGGVSREDERRSARAAIEARYQRAVQDCQGRFAVNACVQEARRARQQALQPLQDGDIAESLAQREQRASESRQRLRQKAQEQARQEAQRRSEALLAVPPRERPEMVLPPLAASDPARPVPDVEKLRREGEAAAAARAREQRQRVQRAEEHRREVLRRLEERAREKPPAAPLPPASGSSAPR